MDDRLEAPPGTVAGSTPRWVVSDVVVEDPTSTHFYDYEQIKGAEVGRYDYEEVACHDRFGMTANEGHPSLLRIGLPTGSGA
jgi:hypothetical protein